MIFETRDGISRRIKVAEHLVSSRCTVRDAAKRFGISKSTVHKDVTLRLRTEDPDLYKRVREVLDRNKADRHLRGGEATRRKYQRIKGSYKGSTER